MDTYVSVKWHLLHIKNKISVQKEKIGDIHIEIRLFFFSKYSHENMVVLLDK